VTLLPEEKKAIEQRGTSSAEAYNLYLMAHNYWVTGNWGDVRQAELVARICKRAVDTDPNYARAWGLLALAQWALHFLHAVADADGRAAADRAIALDPNMAEAQVVKARHLDEEGRLEEAHEALARAVALDPESWEVNHEAGMIVYFRRHFNEAARYFEKAASVDETDFHSWAMLSSVYEALGDEEGVTRAARMAVSRAEHALAKSPTNGSALVTGATGLAVLGEVDRFREWVDRALLVDPNNLIMVYNFACAMARMKNYEGALDLIQRRLENITPTLFRGMLTDPDLDGIRENPRFKAMMKEAQERLGLNDAVLN
jgi:adenylate cyclase